jgi:hypothetical protein
MIIILTSSITAQDRLRANNLEIEKYIIKPVSASDLNRILLCTTLPTDVATD